MGLDTASIKFSCAAKSFGVDFGSVLMIGRQSFIPDTTALQQVFSILGIDHDAEEFMRENSFGEEFFSLLGAQEISSLDYSSYENASIVHDMNSPIANDLRQRYSVVYDGGTLEHVFNVPQALKNCMEMVRVGGHFLQVNIANNFMGHGFWQFSPELIFRAFSAENGFQIEAVLLHEVVPEGGWYLVSDPDQVQSRVVLCNSLPTYILTIAKRVAEVEIFAHPPQQSDYVALWEHESKERPQLALNAKTPTSDSPQVDRPVESRDYLPGPIKRVLRRIQQHARPPTTSSPFDRPYYKWIPESELLRGQLK